MDDTLTPADFDKARVYYEEHKCWRFGWHNFCDWCEAEGIDADLWIDLYREKAAAGLIQLPVD